MSRIHEALQKARRQHPGNSGELPNVEEILSASNAAEAPLGAAAVPDVPPILPGTAAPTPVRPEQPAAPALQRFSKRGDWPENQNNLVFRSGGEFVLGQEQFRTLRSRLYQMRAHTKLRVVLVSSTLPEEGKTFVSLNLAHALASEAGRNVLLVDADMRRANGLSGMLGATSTPGLSDYLLGEQTPEQVIQRGTIDRLYLLPAGRRVAQPGELAGNPRFSALLEQMRHLYDWIIIDTPPILPVADAGVMTSLADGVLLVIKSSSTPIPLVKKAAQEFSKGKLLGVVLNRTQGAALHHYAYYNYGKE